MLKLFFSSVLYLIFSFVWTGGFSLNAQNPNRLELPLPKSSETYQTIPLGDKGVVLISKAERDKYTVQKYGTGFEKDWAIDGQIENSLDLVSTSFDGESVFLLFSKYRSSTYQVVKVNVGPGFAETFVFNTVDRFQITDFKTLGYSAFMAGTIREEPVLIFCNLTTRQSKILPTTIKGANVIQSIEVDKKNRLVNVSFAVKHRREMKMVARSYDETGKLFNEVTVIPDQEYSLLNGHLEIMSDSVQVMIGTYGYANMQSANSVSSQGLYISKIVDNEVAFTRYHSFTDFKNFFNFMSERQQEKMERKIQKKKESGSDLKLNYQLLVHDIIPDGANYTIVAEVFYPEYRYNNNMYGNNYWGNPWMVGSPFGYGLYNPWLWNPYFGPRSYNNQQIFDGFVYTHAIVAGLDGKGGLQWDNSITFDKVKSMELLEKVNVKQLTNGALQLVYSNNGSISSKTIKGSKVLEDNHNVAIESMAGDKVRSTTTDDISYWYGDYYLAWGAQKITNGNSDDAQARGRRNVFYLNKIAFKNVL